MRTTFDLPEDLLEIRPEGRSPRDQAGGRGGRRGRPPGASSKGEERGPEAARRPNAPPRASTWRSPAVVPRVATSSSTRRSGSNSSPRESARRRAPRRGPRGRSRRDLRPRPRGGPVGGTIPKRVRDAQIGLRLEGVDVLPDPADAWPRIAEARFALARRGTQAATLVDLLISRALTAADARHTLAHPRRLTTSPASPPSCRWISRVPETSGSFRLRLPRGRTLALGPPRASWRF